VADFLDSGDAGLAVNAQASVDAKLRPWVGLVEALAGFGVQLLSDPLTEVVVAATPGLYPKAMQVHALVGAIRATLDTPVNAINAPGQAQERGWAVATRLLPQGKDEPPRVQVLLRAGGRELMLEGTHTPHYGSRLTRIDAYEVEVRPQGRFLVTRHKDIPGVLARITALLADETVNVASVSLARDGKGTAMAIIQVDGSVPMRVREALRDGPAILEAHRIRLPD